MKIETALNEVKIQSAKSAALEIARAIVALEKVASGAHCEAAYKPLAEANKAMDAVLACYKSRPMGAHAASIVRAEVMAEARR